MRHLLGCKIYDTDNSTRLATIDTGSDIHILWLSPKGTYFIVQWNDLHWLWGVPEYESYKVGGLGSEKEAKAWVWRVLGEREYRRIFKHSEKDEG